MRRRVLLAVKTGKLYRNALRLHCDFGGTHERWNVCKQNVAPPSDNEIQRGFLSGTESGRGRIFTGRAERVQETSGCLSGKRRDYHGHSDIPWNLACGRKKFPVCLDAVSG